MNSRVAADSLEILVIVDNVTDSLSANPPWVEAKWCGLFTSGASGFFLAGTSPSSNDGSLLTVQVLLGRTSTSAQFMEAVHTAGH